MKKQAVRIIAAFGVLISMLVSLWAQSGGDFAVTQSVIANGGGSSAGSPFAIDSTLGQTFAGESSMGGTFSIGSGFWAAVSAPVTISGTITYGNGAANPSVSNVIITGTGSPGVMTTTAPPGGNAGQYMLAGFGAGSYTVTPTKTGGVNGAISSFDAGRIALHVAGPPNPQLDPTQLIVADVSGNGVVSSFDAGQIAKFVAGPPYTAPGIGFTGTWRFTPVNIAYSSVTTNVTGQDYTALLMGEVSGNWANTGARPAGTVETEQWAVDSEDGRAKPDIIVDLPKMTASADKEIIIPVSVQGTADKGVIAYEFDLRYDPSVIRPLLNPVDLAGTVSRSLTPVVNASEPGLLRVVMYGPIALTGNGVLINLKFTAVGTPGSASPLQFERIMFNEGDPRAKASDGQIEISQ